MLNYNLEGSSQKMLVLMVLLVLVLVMKLTCVTCVLAHIFFEGRPTASTPCPWTAAAAGPTGRA